MSLAGEHATDAETARVVARPPILFLIALLFGFIVDHLLPLPRPVPRIEPAHAISAIVAGFMMLSGLALAVAGIRNFLRAGTPVPTNKPTRALVTTGIHGWTRNPIYVGFLASYLGIGIAVRSPWILILALPLMIVVSVGVIRARGGLPGTAFRTAFPRLQGTRAQVDMIC